MEEYSLTIVFVIGLVFAFLDAYGIGANDVANSFSTSVASRSLTMKQACLIAVFTEFLGALLLGAHTSKTIRDGIINIKEFEGHQEKLMVGMMCALIGSSVWVLTATHFGLPVSTTHSIIGAIIGIGISTFGFGCVNWGWAGKGVLQIVTSWFLSPVAAGIVGALLYSSVKYLVLKRKDPFLAGCRIIPFYFFFTIAINVFFIVYKGSPGLKLNKLGLPVILAITFGAAIFFALFAIFCYVPWIRRIIKGNEALRFYHIPFIFMIDERPKADEYDLEKNQMKKINSEKNTESDISEKTLNPNIYDKKDTNADLEAQEEVQKKNKFGKLGKMLTHGVNQEIANYQNDEVKEIHSNAIVYDNDTERLYSLLQVFTASLASFAHGSNDVANAVGPLTTIYFIWESGLLPGESVSIPIWVLIMGGLAIDLGLVTYGYNVMRSLGNKITLLTPTRGFSVELSACLTVLCASKLSLPVSTTHCITGSTTGIGLCNGNVKALNWKLLAWCFLSWILTLPIAGGIAALFYVIVFPMVQSYLL